MKNKIIFSVFTLLALVISVNFLGCKEYPYEADSENTIFLELSDSSSDYLISKPQQWHITNKRLCVVFGYNFNDEDRSQEIIDLLQRRYGLAEDGGLIYPLIFPDDFKSGGRSYHNNLRLILQDDIENLAGVIILGAPEKTHIALARNQDFWNMNVPYPIVALFPQDDILGLESTCTFVLEKSQTAHFNNSDESEVNENVESTELSISEAPDILIKTINYIMTLDGNLEKDLALSNHVFCMYNGYKIHHYSDPETGLQSINHFIFN